MHTDGVANDYMAVSCKSRFGALAAQESRNSPVALFDVSHLSTARRALTNIRFKTDCWKPQNVYKREITS